MGRHSQVLVPGGRPFASAPARLNRPIPGAGVPARKPLRRPLVLALLAFGATFGMMLVMIVDPYSGAYADVAVTKAQWVSRDAQHLTVAASYKVRVTRDGYKVTVIKAPKLATASVGAPVAGTPDPGSAKAIAKQLLDAKGWGSDQYNCLVALWDRESGWNVYAANPSGAYGIPQAKPGNKMASAGPNWQSNPRTQIVWGLGYIQGRYSTPCGAWAHSQSSGWY
jgi:Transglycosylase SLT domain